MLDWSAWPTSLPGRFTLGKNPWPIVQESNLTTGLVWTSVEKRKSLFATGVRCLNRPAGSKWLYRLRYPKSTAEIIFTFLEYLRVYYRCLFPWLTRCTWAKTAGSQVCLLYRVQDRQGILCPFLQFMWTVTAGPHVTMLLISARCRKPSLMDSLNLMALPYLL